MKIHSIIATIGISCLLMGATCHHDNSIIIAEGSKATELGAAKDEQIAGLKAQVLSEQAAREAEQKQASLAAANFDSILFAAEYLDIGLPRKAIEEESKLGKARGPASNPEEIIKGKDRVIAILQNEVAKAKKLYGEAFDEAEQAKAIVAERDRAIAERSQVIAERDAEIAKLTEEKLIEVETHKNDVKNALAKKDAEFADYKKAEAEKERRWLTNATRIAALGLIVAGAVALAAFKMIGVGGGLVGAGVLVGLISIGIETLTAQKWWPYLCGTVFVSVVVAGIYGVYRLWVKHELDNKKTQAIQDMIDEATVKGDVATVEELKSHLSYRLGDKNSFWGQNQTKEIVKLGLIDPKGEKAIKESEKSVNT